MILFYAVLIVIILVLAYAVYYYMTGRNSAITSYDALQKEIALAKAEIAALNASLDTVRAQLKESQDSNAKSILDLSAKTQEADALKTQLAALNDKLSVLSTNASELQVKNASLQAANDSLTAQVGELAKLKADLETFKSQAAKYDATILDLTRRYMIAYVLLFNEFGENANKIDWQYIKINGDTLIRGIDPSGNYRCLTNGGASGCTWGLSADAIKNMGAPTDASPSISCGADHLARYGTTGTDVAGHWCNKSTPMEPILAFDKVSNMPQSVATFLRDGDPKLFLPNSTLSQYLTADGQYVIP